MQERLPFFAELEKPPSGPAWRWCVQTAVANFVEWMTRPGCSGVNFTARAFELMPQDLTRRIALRHSVDMLRVTMEFFEEVAAGAMARDEDEAIRPPDGRDSQIQP